MERSNDYQQFRGRIKRTVAGRTTKHSKDLEITNTDEVDDNCLAMPTSIPLNNFNSKKTQPKL